MGGRAGAGPTRGQFSQSLGEAEKMKARSCRGLGPPFQTELVEN